MTAAVCGLLIAGRPTETRAQVVSALRWFDEIANGLDKVWRLIIEIGRLEKKPAVCRISAQDLILTHVLCIKLINDLRFDEHHGVIPVVNAYLDNPTQENWELVRDQLSILLTDSRQLLITVKQCVDALDPETLPEEWSDLGQLDRALRLIPATVVAFETADEHSVLRGADAIKEIQGLLYSLLEKARPALKSAQQALENRERASCA